MSAVHAMPVSNQLPDGKYSIGTAFLARRGGEIFLVGAAHSPTRSQPHTRWLEWPTAFQVWLSPTESLTLPLFTDGFLRVPLFRFELRNPDSDLLSDMMAVPVSERDFGNLPSIDLTDELPAPTAGTAVTVYGYPDRQELPKWPYAPATPAAGIILSAEPHLIFAGQMPTLVGHSGGPVFAHSGMFVGMMIGHEDDGRRAIVPAAAIRRLIT
ncbi:MAG: serine protease [Caulobacteraceae bacterium]|nr:serine protease [Caulobacteraceae bacterium]